MLVFLFAPIRLDTFQLLVIVERSIVGALSMVNLLLALLVKLERHSVALSDTAFKGPIYVEIDIDTCFTYQYQYANRSVYLTVRVFASPSGFLSAGNAVYLIVFLLRYSS